jgi:isopenicillin-N epimerase
MTSPWYNLWSLQPGVTYLNHGSFGPSPNSVIAARHEWMRRLEAEPMDFFVRQLENHLDGAREKLGAFVGTRGSNLLFVDNATVGMNIVARSFSLATGDEVLASDHEYGAVLRIWRQTCANRSARLVVQRLPERLESAEQVVDALFSGVTDRTKLLVVSHVTSPTAIILPIEEICRRARQRGLPVCVDGPHAPAAVPIEIDRLGCDYYTASCHKWLSAPFGSGFLFVHPRRQQQLEPPIVSWGKSLSGRAPNWHDEFDWSGTRDYSAFLTIPDAIEFFEQIPNAGKSATNASDSPTGVKLFRSYSHELARYARQRIVELTGLAPIIPDSTEWYGSMIALPLPDSVAETAEGHMHPLQTRLWEKHRIEVPVINWRGRRWIRVSCHLYNDRSDIDRLVDALQNEIPV